MLRPSSDVDTDLVRSISPELDAAVGEAQVREGMVIAATNQDCTEDLAGTQGAIGPSSLTQLLTESNPPRAVAWNGVAPTLQNLASGDLPPGEAAPPGGPGQSGPRGAEPPRLPPHAGGAGASWSRPGTCRSTLPPLP